MRRRRIKQTMMLVVLGATVTGTPLLLQLASESRVRERKPEASVETAVRASDLPCGTMKPGTFAKRVADGIVEAVRIEDVVSPVEGAAVIVSMLTEETLVHQGALVCTLEPSRLSHRRAGLRVTAKEAEQAENVPGQVERCQLYAPADGTLQWADARPHFGDRLKLKPGDTVLKGQCILQLRDNAGPLRVRTKVHENLMSGIKTGMPARIRFEPCPEEVFRGTVREIGVLPLPEAIRSSPYCETLVSIQEGAPVARPGMNAQVEILVSDRDDVLSLPREAALSYPGKDLVAVKRPDGGFDWREIRQGARSESRIEVGQGLTSGDCVCLNPIDLMRAQENARQFGSSSQPVSR